LFTALVFEDLDRTLVSCKNHPDYHIGNHVLFISSVSGGTLATACYIDEKYRRQSSTALSYKPKNFFADETLALMIDALPSIKGRPWYEGTRSNGSWVEWWRAAEACCGDNEDSRWFFKRPLVDDMCTDFMAPLLRGVLYPLNDRGQSTMQFWQRRFGLSATNLDWHRRIAARLSEAVSEKGTVVPKPTDWPPLLLCNVSEVERGNRTMIGFPPLPPDLLTFDIDAPHFPREFMALDAGDGKIDRVCEVSLAEATRLSANFPWGFPVARVDIPQRTPTGGQRPDVRFVDGAVADNTGIDSLRYVVDRLRAWANRAGRPAAIPSSEQRRYQIAKQIVDELMRRGIVVLEIDSGAKPQSPGFMARSLSGLLEPVAALENASYAHGSADVGTNLSAIEANLPFRQARQLRWRIERLASPVWHDGGSDRQNFLPNVERITVICNHEENVMTAWALGPRDKAHVFLRFAAGSAKLHDQWEDYLERYYREREEVAKIDKALQELERLHAAGKPAPADQLAELSQNYRILVGGSQMEEKLRRLDLTVEAQIAQRTPPSTAQLAHIAAQIMDDQRRQLYVIPPGEPIPLPPVEAADATSLPASSPKSSDQQQRLQQDYSRVGESMRSIQQKASAVNNDAVQKLRPLK
jgi:hypothetical protein